MIRINLVPGERKKKKRRLPSAPEIGGSERMWWGVFAGIMLVWVIGLGIFHTSKAQELDDLVQENEALKAQHAQLEKKTKKLADVEEKLEVSKKLEEVVTELQKARTGPARVLMELSAVLSVNEGPTVDPDALKEMRRENPLAGFNEEWDVRRLWLKGFEEDEKDCRITGLGRTNEDVAEFYQRLSLSDLFENVTLQRTRSEKDKDSGLDMVAFDLTCRVAY